MIVLPQHHLLAPTSVVSLAAPTPDALANPGILAVSATPIPADNTWMYVGGGVLALGALVLLVKRRKGSS
jgi:LPXTG-motif cell wall-anchored protein